MMHEPKTADEAERAVSTLIDWLMDQEAIHGRRSRSDLLDALRAIESMIDES